MKTLSSTPRMDAAFNQPTSTTPRMNWQLDQCYREGCKLERELAGAREQRDWLVEVLDRIAVLYESKEMTGTVDQRIADAYDMRCMARAALAAVEGGSDE